VPPRFLYQRGLGAVVASVKACWASAFTDRAVEYRHRHGVPHAGTVMAVVVQDMVESTVAGTAFSVELNTGFPAAQVAASYGLGEAVVSGEVTSDEWLFDRTTMACIKRVLGSKKCEYVPRSGASGCDKVAVEERRRARFCMDLDTARRVAAATLKVRAVYEQLFGYDDVDTEFAVAGADTVLHLQSRPVVALGAKEILTVDRRAARSRVVAKGSYSLLGAVTGTCRVIRNFEDLISGKVSIRPDDVVVTAKTSNYWNQYLTSLRGIVTEDGSPTAHPMLIGRERHLAVLCGIPGVVDKLAKLDGRPVTLDGLTKAVYAGHLELHSASRFELEGEFRVQQPTLPKKDSDVLAFLKSYGRCRFADDDVWIHNPNSPLSPWFAALRTSVYPARAALLETALGTNAPKPDVFCGDFRIFEDGVVADKFVPIEDTLRAFQNVGLAECRQYHDAVDDAGRRYHRACAAFAAAPSVATWRAYAAAFAPLHAALWLSFFWRMHVKQLSSALAADHGVAHVHYDEMLTLAHDELGKHDEDARFTNELVDLADELRHECLSGAEQLAHAREGSVSHEAKHLEAVRALAARDPAVAAKLRGVAARYRVLKDTDVGREPPYAAVLEKVTEAIEQGACRAHDHADDAVVEYYPEAPAVHEAAKQATYARTQNSNAHHWKWRGTALVRLGLKQVADALELDFADFVTSAASLEDVEKRVAAYERWLETAPMSARTTHANALFASFGLANTTRDDGSTFDLHALPPPRDADSTVRAKLETAVEAGARLYGDDEVRPADKVAEFPGFSPPETPRAARRAIE
jgi:phosphohistidine swiveling domain-containing protein